MPPNQGQGGGDLQSSMDEATRAIEELTRAIARGGGAGGRGAGGGIGRGRGGGGGQGEGFLSTLNRARGRGAGAGPVGARGVGGPMAVLGAVASAVDPVAENLAITGNLSTALQATAGRGAVSAIGEIPVIGAATGARAADQVLQRTERRLGSLADMARQGIEISDDMIQREASVVIEQEKRAQNVEARIAGALGSAENIKAAVPDVVQQGGMGIDRLVEIGEKILGAMPGGSQS